MEKKTALELMNSPEEELERGQQAAVDLVAHMKRMRADGTTFEIPDGSGVWKIDIEWTSKKDSKPN